MNSEEEFFDAETGEPVYSIEAHPSWIKSALGSPVTRHHLTPSFSCLPGLESDDSGEVSFKDALVFDSKKVTGGGTTQENGVWERR